MDVPIGFGPRGADPAARAFLSGAASTVFTTPPRELLASCHSVPVWVSPHSRMHSGHASCTSPDSRSGDPRFREVHPDVSFRAMNDGRPLGYRKRWAGGALERIRLFAGHGIDLGDLGAATCAPLDDVLDAAAAAWSAHRIATGEARALPDPPEMVEGQPVAIWY